MRADTFTTTVADAEYHERNFTGPGFEGDVPSRSELSEDAAMDIAMRSARERREEAARARGVFVPTQTDRMLASLVESGLRIDGYADAVVTIVRDAVLRIDGLPCDATPEQRVLTSARVVEDPWHVAEKVEPDLVHAEGVLWVRRHQTSATHGEPF